MPQDDETRSAPELREQLSELRAEVEDLRASLTAARNRAELTMRGQRRCPACGGEEIYHAAHVLDRDQGRARMSLVLPSIWRSKGAGELEAYVCGECGKVEWYVKDTESLAEHLTRLEPIQPDRGSGPYR